MYNLNKNEWSVIQFKNIEIVPSCRIYHCGCLCLDNIYFFGGEYLSDQQFDELWKLDLNEKWTNVEFNGNDCPEGRRYATMASKNEFLYLFGGRNEVKRFNDLWQFNTITSCWEEISTKGDIPKARAGHVSVLSENLMWIYGGNK